MAERKGLVDAAHSLSVRTQCDLMEVCRSSLYYKPTPKLDDLKLLNLIREIWQRHPFYGYRKITAVLALEHQEAVKWGFLISSIVIRAVSIPASYGFQA